jgi:hypothetical protein
MRHMSIKYYFVIIMSTLSLRVFTVSLTVGGFNKALTFELLLKAYRLADSVCHYVQG